MSGTLVSTVGLAVLESTWQIDTVHLTAPGTSSALFLLAGIAKHARMTVMRVDQEVHTVCGEAKTGKVARRILMLMPTPNLHSVVTPDGATILHTGENRVIRLNAIGAYIWERMERGTRVKAIVDELAHECGEDIARVDRDVREFLDQLVANSILVDSKRNGGHASE